MTITNVKAMIAKVATVGLLAGAVILAAPGKAEAQVRFGVSFGGPVYRAPVYAPPVRYIGPPPVYGYGYGFAGPGHFGHDEWIRQQEYLRHREFEREHFYHGGYRR